MASSTLYTGPVSFFTEDAGLMRVLAIGIESARMMRPGLNIEAIFGLRHGVKVTLTPMAEINLDAYFSSLPPHTKDSASVLLTLLKMGNVELMVRRFPEEKVWRLSPRQKVRHLLDKTFLSQAEVERLAAASFIAPYTVQRVSDESIAYAKKGCRDRA